MAGRCRCSRGTASCGSCCTSSSCWGRRQKRSGRASASCATGTSSPNWRKQSLAEHFPTLEPAGVDLLDAMFIYDPADRITVRSHTSVPALYGSLLWPICDACTKPLIPWLESLISCRGLLCFACLRHCSAASAAAPTLAMYHMLLAFFPSPHEEQTACASSAIQTLKKMLAHDGGSCACRRRMRCTTPTLMTWTRTR